MLIKEVASVTSKCAGENKTRYGHCYQKMQRIQISAVTKLEPDEASRYWGSEHWSPLLYSMFSESAMLHNSKHTTYSTVELERDEKGCNFHTNRGFRVFPHTVVAHLFTKKLQRRQAIVDKNRERAMNLSQEMQT